MSSIRMRIVPCSNPRCNYAVTLIYQELIAAHYTLLELGWHPDLNDQDTWSCKNCSVEMEEVLE